MVSPRCAWMRPKPFASACPLYIALRRSVPNAPPHLRSTRSHQRRARTECAPPASTVIRSVVSTPVSLWRTMML